MDRFRDAHKSVIELIPAYYRENDPEQIMTRLCAVFDDEFTQWDTLLDELRAIKDPFHATEKQVSYLYAEKGFEPPLMVSLDRRRDVLFRLSEYIKQKGDPRNLRNVVIALTGLGVDAVPLWSSDRYWRSGQSRSGVDAVVGIAYTPQTQNAMISGVTKSGHAKIGTPAIGRELVYTVLLQLSRRPTANEESAIRWACNYFTRAIDRCVLQYPGTGSQYWTVGQSRVGIDTKVRSSCWVSGVSHFGVTSVICAPTPTIPDPYITPASPGVWVPNYDGGGTYDTLLP